MKYKISKIEIIWAVLSFPLFLFILTTVLSGAGNMKLSLCTPVLFYIG